MFTSKPLWVGKCCTIIGSSWVNEEGKAGKLDMAVNVMDGKEGSFTWCLEIRMRVPSLLLRGLLLCLHDWSEGLMTRLLC